MGTFATNNVGYAFEHFHHRTVLYCLFDAAGFSVNQLLERIAVLHVRKGTEAGMIRDYGQFFLFAQTGV